MNYSWAFSTDEQIQAKIVKGFPDPEAWQYRAKSRENLEKFAPFISELCLSGKYEIVLRPHPSILPEQWVEAFDRILGGQPKGLKITKAHSIREWIAASDVVGSSWSTSVLDAKFCGKPAFLFLPVSMPDWLWCDWFAEVPNISSSAEVDLLTAGSQHDVSGFDPVRNVAVFLSGLAGEVSTFARPDFYLSIYYLKVFCKRWAARYMKFSVKARRLLTDDFSAEYI
jgi:hypothetical protein